MSVNGTFYNVNDTKASIWPAPVAFPVRNENGRSLQAHLTEWTWNSALEAGYSTDNTFDVTYFINEVTNYTLNTTTVGTVIPQIEAKYGKGVPISMSGKFIN